MKKISTIALYSFLVLALAFGLVALPARAADHLDAPFVDTDGRIDITDVYAFTHGSNTVLIMNVDPVAGVLSPNTFRSDALYEFRIDNTGVAKQDVAFRFHFSSPNSNGQQNVVLKMATGKQAQSGNGGGTIAKGSTGGNISVSSGGSVLAGLGVLPFFFCPC